VVPSLIEVPSSPIETGGSAFREDMWIARHFELPAAGVCIDIGASDGIRASNSLFFEQLGWWCLCVEPDPRNWAKLVSNRPVCEQLAISDRTDSQTLWLHPDKPTHSSLEPSEPVDYQAIDVVIETLSQLVSRHGLERIDLLSIDVEGHELAVWRSLDLAQVRPALVIVEYADGRPNSSWREVTHAFTTDGYREINRTPANLIYQDCRGSTPWLKSVDPS